MSASVFESIMLICFGCSWPINAWKSFKMKSAKGKSLTFLLLIWFGYIAGITGKFVSHNITYVLVIYFFNFFFVTCDLVLYFINTARDKKRENA